MAVFEGTIYSESLGMMTSLSVSLPLGKAGGPEGEMPVLYLLHGLSENHSAWLRRSRADYYAEQAGIALVMPEVQRSFYCDMACGLDYYTYVAEELPVLCRQMFRLSDRREDTFVAGLSMGGYGALKLALRRPGRCAAAGSFSGATDVRARLAASANGMAEKEIASICGGCLAPEDDLFPLAEQAVKGGPIPALYISCGESDFMIEDNRRFHRHLDALGIGHTYEEWPGTHNWDFWDESIRRALGFFVRLRG